MELELQLPASITATATPDLSHICHYNSGSALTHLKARDRTRILMVTSPVRFTAEPQWKLRKHDFLMAGVILLLSFE